MLNMKKLLAATLIASVDLLGCAGIAKLDRSYEHF
jgi:hypothetical protein